MISKDERETHICFLEGDKKAYVYTCHKPFLNKLDGFCDKSSEFSVRYRAEGEGDYIIPMKSISFRLPMVISDELRAKKVLQGKRLSGYKAKNKKAKLSKI